MHTDAHPLAGKTVTLNENAGPERNPRNPVVPGAVFRIEDWWDRLTGKSWGDCEGNPACIIYAVRTGVNDAKKGNQPNLDDEVVYGKIDGLGHLVHVSELGEEVK